LIVKFRVDPRPVIERPFGRLLALLAIVALSPLLVLVAVAIKLSSKGPALYRSQRVGRNGALFTMLKFRTMRVGEGPAAGRITAAGDPRVSRLGGWLRRCKLDELPQLVNVARGQMALVGPRPEDPTIVDAHYGPLMRETLTVAPGLSSPGTLAYYAQERELPGDPVGAEATYLTELLPLKIARDLAYVRARSWRYDAQVVVRTVAAVAGAHNVFRRRQAWEVEAAAELLPEIQRECTLTAGGS
jgi:lipopolysaccharide/colanic/teichoic acid biosynthesis glycosyltransferase